MIFCSRPDPKFGILRGEKGLPSLVEALNMPILYSHKASKMLSNYNVLYRKRAIRSAPPPARNHLKVSFY
jgi:hypothetical protein